MTPTITLLASGTRGDVQPYLALGIGLRDAGYHVCVATHANFAAMVAATGLTFARLDDNPSDLFARPGGEYALRFDLRHPLRNLRATIQYWHAARPVFARLLVSAWRAAQGSDALVIGLPTLWGARIADALGVPHVRGLLQPFTPTREFPSPLLPFRFSLGAIYNRLTYRIVEQSMWLAWRSTLQQGRWSSSTRLYSTQEATAFTLYGFSAHVVPRPSDWLAAHQITGYWCQSTPANFKPAPELERFLEAGNPPVYIGFGSLGVRDPRATLASIIDAVGRTGLRAVLAVARDFAETRWAENILPVHDVPHEWLFPKMAAVVHHGGAGTTGAGLRAGVPTLIIPLAVDQFFWGDRVARLGVGAQPIPQSALTVDSLARALERVTTDPAMKKRAQELSNKLNGEDGVARAVELIRARL